MTGKLSKNFHVVGIGPLSKIYAVKEVTNTPLTFGSTYLINYQDLLA